MVVSALSRAGRIIIGLSHAELAERAGLPIVTIDQAGADREPGTFRAAAIRAILEGQGVLFLKEVKDPGSDCAAQIPMTSPCGQTS
jgi:hypothetical protein